MGQLAWTTQPVNRNNKGDPASGRKKKLTSKNVSFIFHMGAGTHACPLPHFFKKIIYAHSFS